jgi:FkbM family methyltransferase
MGLVQTIRGIVGHPLNRGRRARALVGYLRWQLGSRLVGAPVAVPFTDTARLLIARGMAGATGNIYCGLHDFGDMAFALHLLRPGDLFADVGANIGSYTILAAAVAGARCAAAEPVPAIFRFLLDNVALNRVGQRVACHNVGVGRAPGVLRFTTTEDPTNHVLAAGEVSPGAVERPVRTLDELLGGEAPALIKIDTEGFETEVIAGAPATLREPALKAVVLELNGSGRRYGYDEDALHGAMLQLGFAPYSYDPFRRELHPLGGRHYAGNTLYVRDLPAVRERLRGAPAVSVFGRQV